MEDKHKNQESEALAMVQAVADEGLATINGTDYEFTSMTHKQRRKVFAFYTKVAQDLKNKNFSFLDSAEWDGIEKLLGDHVLVDGVQINKHTGDYWDKNAGDYLQFVATAMPVICYPFMQGDRS